MSCKSFVLIGHVDHGKSTLAGRILCDVGFVTDREIEKLKAEADRNKMGSWWLSYLLDTDEHERLRGKTHQYNMIEFEHDASRYRLIDVPGHKQMVTEMIAGASEADIAVVVVSARNDEYIQGLSGQTLEHLLIARGMGLTDVVVAVNKMDCCDWSSEKLAQVQKVIEKHLKKLRFKTVEFCPISALTGEGVVNPREGSSLSLLSVIKNTNRSTKSVEPHKLASTDTIVVDSMFNNVDSIITLGCPLIVHYGQEIAEGTLKLIKGKPFIKSSNEVVRIAVKFSDPLLNNVVVPNVIFRSGDKTVGFGKIINFTN